MSILLIKVTLMPLVMGVVTLASRKWGNKVGGLIASLPWVVGPILLFFILEQGKDFGIRAVPGILTGIVSLVGFCYSYVLLSRRFSWLPTLLISYVVYVLAALPFDFVKLDVVLMYTLAMVSIGLALRYFPTPAAPPVPLQVRRLPFDMIIRMVVATLFVVAITELANLLGPAWSGILAPFPIVTSILAVFTHYLQGSSACVIALRGLVMGLFGVTTFLFLQAFLLSEFSVGLAFLFALLVNLFINFVVTRVL